MSKPEKDGNRDWQSLLHYKVGYKGQYKVDDIALCLDRAKDTIRRYINGTKIMPPDLIRDFIKFTVEKNPDDMEFLNFFCLDAGFLPVKVSDSPITSGEIIKQELEMSVLNGKSIEAIEKAMEDGRIEQNEWKEIHSLLCRLRKVATEIDKKIEGSVK